MQRIAISLCSLAALFLAPVARAATEVEQEGVFRGSVAQSVAALIAFGIVVVILGKFAWGPIIKALQDRENKIKGDLEQAEAANRKAQATLAEYEKKIADAHAEARKLVDQARADAELLRQRLAGETQTEIGKMRDRATAEIRQAKTQAVEELYAHASMLSVAVAEKILQRKINDADTQALVDRSLRELDSVKA